MNKIRLWISKLVCKWADFAGLGNDKDVLCLKESIRIYKESVTRRKREGNTE